MVKYLLLVSFVVWSYTEALTSPDLDQLWNSFIKVHSKSYATNLTESALRKNIWKQNVDFIQKHNLEFDMGLHSYRLGINEYADLTKEEAKKYLRGFVRGNGLSSGQMFPHKLIKELPDEMDWRTKGYVTPIKNQGQCGSCWAFSSTGSMEGQHFRRTGKLVSLSEQNLIDCTEKYGNAGCNGGWMDNAFKYVKENGGIDQESFYPYEAHDDWCGYRADVSGATVTGWFDVAKGDEVALKAAVGSQGPVSIAIDATSQQFMLYESGIFDNPTCSNVTTDHAVLAVGYGTQKGQDYWLVKNSWGTSWGLDGYIMMTRNKNNQCAIATYASYPTE